MGAHFNAEAPGAFGHPFSNSAAAKWTLRVAATSFAIAAVIATDAKGSAQSTPSVGQPPATVWLDQGWTDDQRRIFHHQSQGTLTFPVETSWFLALQQPEDYRPTAGLFSDPAYLEQFGFIPSPADAVSNPNGLPVGFARTIGSDPTSGKHVDRIGFTCAACHTGRITFHGTEMLIDGGPALIDTIGFGTKLALALGETYLSMSRFNRFAKRVLGENSSLPARARLHWQLGQVLATGLGDFLQGPFGGTKEGFGRLDALNRIGNTVFASGMKIRANAVATSAPVAYPHIWDVAWFSWVQYNGSIERPMVRNAGEAMGVGAAVNYHEGPTPLFTSTIPINKLYDPIEKSLAGNSPFPAMAFSGLRSPRWPENILGRINPQYAARGAALYQQLCQGCHLPAANTPEFWASNRWLPANAVGERYLDLKMIDIAKVGTDPAQAQKMRDRKVYVPLDLKLSNPVGKSGKYGIYPYGEALGELVERVVNRWYDSQNPPTPVADRDRMNGYRANGIRRPLQYKARPLDGIWATAPYLHNGSVPTLWHLLSPYDERNDRKVFFLGNREFDPIRVGYVNGGPFKLDTTRPGNHNSGHLFETPSDPSKRRPGTIGPYIPPNDRLALIEYLKTL